jgi:hypothetical protein
MLGGAAAPRKHPPSRQSVTSHHTMKPLGQVGNGENYPSFDSPDRGVASLILGVGKTQSRADSDVRFDPLGASLRDDGVLAFTGFDV